MSTLGVIKSIGAWVCIVGAVVLLILDHGAAAVPGVLALLSIAFSQAP